MPRTRATSANASSVEVVNPCHDCERDLNAPDNEGVWNAEREGDRFNICEQCFHDNYQMCENCSIAIYDGERSENGYCPSCADRYESNDSCDEDSLRCRDYSDTKKYLEEVKAGKILRSTRGFGVELEMITNDYEDANKIAREIPKEIGIEHDGSISGDAGMEIQTPQIAGDKAEALITSICEVFKKHDASVNTSCGYHIHIDMNDLMAMSASEAHRAMRSLWLFYITFEDVIMSFLPQSRRKNTYCNVLRSDYHFNEIYNAQNIDQLEKIWYRATSIAQINRHKAEKKHGSRYRGINLHTLFSEKHAEIRYHSGTINAKKILEWANLHTRIADITFRNGIDMTFLHENMNDIDLKLKTDNFFKALRLEQSSEQYFRARQAMFLSDSLKTAPVSKEATEEVNTLQANENER